MRKVPRSVLAAAVLLVLVALWVASGMRTREPVPAPPPPERVPMRVAVATLEAADVQQVLTLQGSLEPSLTTLIRAETAGRIEALPVRRGAAVEAGDLIARLAPGERQALLARAQATLAQARRDHEASRKLAEEGFMPPQKVDSALAQVRAAEAELAAAKLDLARTRVRAPVGGVVRERLAEEGEWVGVGEPIVEVVQNDPLSAVVQVPQRHIHAVRRGAPATVRALGQEPRAGKIVSVDAVADGATRTFRVEIELANPGRELPSGVSAQVEIATASVSAHKISPAMLRLSDAGEVGVMALDAADRARFHPIEVVRAEADGLWVSGLPPRLRVITAGHSFVREGEPVVAVERAHEQ